MASRKPAKQKVARRAPGLVITPPAARPSEGVFNPFREAREAEKREAATDRLSLNESLSLNRRLSPTPQEGHQNESLLFSESLSFNESLSEKSVDLWASVPQVKGHCKLPHVLTDHLYKLLDVPERVVYEQLYRLSWGFGKDLCDISLHKLAARAGLKPTATHAAVTRLVAKNLVVKMGATFGRNKEQGIAYKLPLPEWLTFNESLSRNESLSLNDNNKEKNTIKETHTNREERLAPRVRVEEKSQFSLKQCRAYAEHLSKTGQGITNPGGYATKIHRSGEADELIAAFLAPSEPSVRVDPSLCPDCRGTGFYEPAGAGKGVAKCKHKKLPQRS